MAVFSVAAMAQQNLRDGYVITLQGDTLQGVIDFRTASPFRRREVLKRENTLSLSFTSSFIKSNAYRNRRSASGLVKDDFTFL